MGYEAHEDDACITHRNQSPDFYPLNSHLITLTLDTTFNRSVPCTHSVSQNRIAKVHFLVSDGIDSSK
jgi:hypothetical protein